MTNEKEHAERVGPGRQKLRALNALVEREARYADAMRDAYRAHLSPDFPPTDGWANLSRAVTAVADAEIAAQVEAAVSVAEFSVHQWQQSYLSATEHARELQARAESAEADLRALREGLAEVVERPTGDCEGAPCIWPEDLRALLAPSPVEDRQP